MDDLRVCKAVAEHLQSAGKKKTPECRSHMIPLCVHFVAIQYCSVVDGYKCQDTSAHKIKVLYCITWKVILEGLENCLETCNWSEVHSYQLCFKKDLGNDDLAPRKFMCHIHIVVPWENPFEKVHQELKQKNQHVYCLLPKDFGGTRRKITFATKCLWAQLAC